MKLKKHFKYIQIIKINILGPTEQYRITSYKKAVSLFTELTKKVKRKKVWGVQMFIVTLSKKWLIADCFIDPIKCRGIEDLPNFDEFIP